MDLQKLKDAYSKVSDDTKKAVRALFLSEDEPNETEETAETVTEEVEAALAEDQKFVEIPDEEGNILVIEPDLQVGASIMLLDPATGDQIETPDASYTLADGTTIEVEGGEIRAINPAEEVEEEMPEEEEELAAEPAAEREPKTITERTEVEKRFEAENAELKEELNKSNEKIEELTNTVEEFKTILTEFGAMPTADPVQEPKTPYTSRLKKAMENNTNTKFKTQK